MITGAPRTDCYTADMSRIPTARTNGRRWCLVAALALLAAAESAAVTVHTWVDAAGVRHYADQPPAAASDVEAFEIVDSAPLADAAADYYSVTNQWARVRAEREAAQARRAEIAAARAAQAPAWRTAVRRA